MRSLRVLTCIPVILLPLVFPNSFGQSSQPQPGRQSKIALNDGPGGSGGHTSEGREASPAPASPASAKAKDESQQESVFDSLSNSIKPVITSVEVHGIEEQLDTSSPAPLIAGGDDVVNLAGTYGDISRYLQVFPGVVASSDLSNQVLVRGGHPMENLFLIDGIEVPNINHLANANTTGGLGPMIDAAAIQGLQMYTGGFDAKFPERLSSVTEFRTLDSGAPNRHLELDFGIQGVGGLAETNVKGGNLLVSAHHGLLNLVSNDIGVNGVPSYTNALTRYRKTDTSGNHLTLLNVAGWDSIEITPCASDADASSTINSQYDGWRETTGGDWQRIYSNRSFAVFDFSDSEQVEHINEQDQFINPINATYLRHACPLPKGYMQTTPVYREDSNAAFSTLKYRFEWANSPLAFTAGSSAWLERPNFNVAQPVGAFSPYLSSPTRSDSASFDSNFSTGETGSFVQFVVHPVKPLSVSAGGRVQTFALGNRLTLTPRLNASYRLGEKMGVHAAYGAYAQLPPYAYMLAYSVNRSMSPMRASHEIVGMDFSGVPFSQIRVEAYNKDYKDVPASTEYPAVTLHTMVDMLGEQIVWLPMKSAGHGNASGIEVSDISRAGSRLQIQGSLAYSRARFAGTDGTLRPSNFDFPWIANIAGISRLGHGVIVSARYGYATGRPYTPFDMPLSLAQNRPIYDLSKVNVPRAPYYSRLDAQLNKDIRIHDQHLELYGGVENILNRSNFLSYAWMPLTGFPNPRRDAVATLWQTPIFPNFGLRLVLR